MASPSDYSTINIFEPGEVNWWCKELNKSLTIYLLYIEI
ncbi:DUF3606 domain-containing protein [Clostridium arbusti]